ncbi:MAG: VWA domain-containing protein [Runella slithyformis]|nr:MAG: VWA domain-containing protein [Runella slithyformis]TAF94551.1 MAG: VWA domain-containing protein [Runella sp.]TAG20331.1 MAG: VWA domain-containing protein [Cytophagales bacterium]TAG39487.1 MAG: VWA domain-containing protein [Cytophagia bacterium]TAF43179.1 MAG: VWA domain-containing protein [Runella slithyformis]
MNFNYELTQVEYLFIGLFILLYLLYIGRTLWVARALGLAARAVVLKFFLRSLYFGLLIVSVLGPFFGEMEGEIVSKGKDVFVMVDISKSMDATDVAPTRLEKTKFELQQLIATLSQNRFGLISFSSDAFLQVPLTFDMGALGLFVQSLSTAQTSSAGTDVCQALALAVEKQLTNTKADNTTKILLLLTDGEDFGTCDRRLLTKIRQYGMHLIIVGVGTQTGGTVKVGPNLLKDEDGQVVITRLNGTYLRELAIATNGQYFEMSPKTSVLSNIRAAIDTVQGRLIDSRKVTVNSNKYRYFLVVALVLLLLDVLATVTTFQI